MSLNGEWIQKMWYIYTMEYYSDIKNNTFIKFLGASIFSQLSTRSIPISIPLKIHLR